MLRLWRRRFCSSAGSVEQVLAALQERSLLAQVTRVSSSPPPAGCAVYCGFDPTASSLHLGHLLAINALLLFRRAGYQAIAVVGGATGRVGDPSGRSRERDQLSEEALIHNTATISRILSAVFSNDGGDGPDIKIVNNNRWWEGLEAVQFVSDIAKHFRVKAMLHKESVQQRMECEEGLSCAEFLYPCFQAFDFLHLHTDLNCWMQVGGGDQWGNITAGCEFVRKRTGNTVHGVTVPLLTSSSGEKLGKSAGNAVWLSPSGYQLYQQLLQTPDLEVGGRLKSLTLEPLELIMETMKQHTEAPEKYLAQKLLAETVTRMVHGEEGLQRAQMATRALFRDPALLHSLTGEELVQLFSDAPATSLTSDLLTSITTIAEVALRAAVVPSKYQLDRLLGHGGLYLNGWRVEDEGQVFSCDEHVLPGNLSVFRVGKKTHHLVQWSQL